jgi:uncharacterized metal-binding protein
MEDRGTSCTKGLTVGEKNVAALREVVVFYPCGGGSNVGLMTTEAVRILVKEKRGKMACLAGVGGHVPTMILNANAASKVVCIDGCPIQCARKSLEHAGVKPHVSVVATDIGVRKEYELEYEWAKVERLAQILREILG